MNQEVRQALARDIGLYGESVGKLTLTSSKRGPSKHGDCPWTRYWQYGRIASCMDDRGRTNYADCIAASWREFFSKLPGHSSILDLCTGNGAVALLATEVSRTSQKNFTIVGVDRAKIDPASFVPAHAEALSTISFKPGVAIEDMPFRSHAFDAIVSQYGFEYSDIERSALEVVRVLKPGGSIRLVMHATEGTVSANAREAIRHADFLLEETNLPGCAASAIQAVKSAEESDNRSPIVHQEALDAVGRFQRAVLAARKFNAHPSIAYMIADTVSVLIDTYRKRSFFELEVLLDKVNEVQVEIAAHRARSQELVESGLDRGQLTELAARLESWGTRKLTYSELRNNDSLVAHVLETPLGSSA